VAQPAANIAITAKTTVLRRAIVCSRGYWLPRLYGRLTIL
jgi:hypothetical protein